MRQNLQQKQQKTDWLNKRIRHPKDQLQIFKNKLNELNQQNIRSIKNTLLKSRSQTNLLKVKLQQHAPLQRVRQLQLQYKNINNRFQHATKQIMSIKMKKLQHLIYTLDAVSPLHTLKRGYAIVKDENNHIIRNVLNVKKNQLIKTEFAKGSVFSTITEINND